MQTIITLDDKKFGQGYYNAAHVETIDDTGIHQAKYVDVYDLLNALMNSRIEKERSYHIGKLPQYYFDGMIYRSRSGAFSGQMLLAVPKTRTITQFHDTRYEIPFPALLFVYHLKDGRIVRSQVYALKGKKWDYKTELFLYPFGNVHTGTCEICWGSNVLPEIKELSQLDVVTSLFYSSSTNNDLYSPERTKWRAQNVRELYELLKDKTRFPENKLVPCDKGCIGNLIEDQLKEIE